MGIERESPGVGPFHLASGGRTGLKRESPSMIPRRIGVTNIVLRVSNLCRLGLMSDVLVRSGACLVLLLSFFVCVAVLRGTGSDGFTTLGMLPVKCVSGDWCARLCRIPARAATALHSCLLGFWPLRLCAGPVSVALCWVPVGWAFCRLGCPDSTLRCCSLRKCGAGWTMKCPLCFAIPALVRECSV